MSGLKSILIIAVCLLSLALIWGQFDRPGNPSQQAPAAVVTSRGQAEQLDALLARIQTLEDELSASQLWREQLQTRVARLEQRVDPSPGEQASAARPEDEPDPVTTDKNHQQPQNLQDRLLAAGIPPDSVQRIKLQLDQNRLELLQLRDQAIREGWLDSTEYNEKASELRDPGMGLREQLGDSTYDIYLYASGRPNRVIVNEVYSGSAADGAGIQPQDIILSYASQRIFSMTDLQQATVEGIAGQAVLVEIQRNKLPFTTSVPRGPLGISMTIIRQQPENPY